MASLCAAKLYELHFLFLPPIFVLITKWPNWVLIAILRGKWISTFFFTLGTSIARRWVQWVFLKNSFDLLSVVLCCAGIWWLGDSVRPLWLEIGSCVCSKSGPDYATFFLLRWGQTCEWHYQTLHGLDCRPHMVMLVPVKEGYHLFVCA